MVQEYMSTPRLHLQPLNEAHLVHFKELNSRPEVFRFIHQRALTEQEATDDHAARLAAGTPVPGLGVWSDLLADGGEFVGWWALSPVGCGLAQALDDTQPDIVLSLRNVHEFNSISERPELRDATIRTRPCRNVSPTHYSAILLQIQANATTAAACATDVFSEALAPRLYNNDILFYAAKWDKLELAKIALRATKNVNKREPERKVTALAMAFENGFDDVAKLILREPDVDADAFARGGSRNMTPLEHAARTGNVEIAKLLLQSNAKAQIKNSPGVLAIAAESGSVEMAELLYNNGSCVNEEYPCWTAEDIECASETDGSEQSASTDESEPYDDECRWPNRGRTALVIAACGRRAHLVEWLLNRNEIQLNSAISQDALSEAVLSNEDECLLRLLRSPKVSVADEWLEKLHRNMPNPHLYQTRSILGLCIGKSAAEYRQALQAHSSVLATQSPYFSKALLGKYTGQDGHNVAARFIENRTETSVSLKEAFKHMPDNKCTDDERLTRDVRVYQFTDYFGIDDFQVYDLGKLKTKAKSLWTSQGFIDCIPELYASTTDAQCQMRRAVIDIICEHSEDISKVLEEPPVRGKQFAADLLNRLSSAIGSSLGCFENF
ncbi:ankyrin repeat protein [Beauveria bassiana ARSEF 2860]|uniref:Ankyrin repeat protein n=1 Tax=Beauveria bassiana (strain ARSEF 2860) TaxID=655819 RepID=J4VR53_BEAB2|nr:ankyrin repeat protein [Beauveria bassiana ARSEF 2860]EJP61135.1 ankyrin repeat protein [Beauveria bassiana ARSEF 2860]